MKIFSNVFSRVMWDVCRSEGSPLSRKSDHGYSSIDAFARTSYTREQAKSLTPHGLNIYRKLILSGDASEPTSFEYAKFLTNNCFRLNLALEILNHRTQGLLDADTLSWRGAVKVLLGRHDAILDLEHALKMDPKHTFARLNKVAYLIHFVKFCDSECDSILTDVLNEDPCNQHALLLQAINLSGRPVDHLAKCAAFKEIVKAHPGNDFAWAGLAMLSLQENEERCRYYVKRALDINPTNFCAAALSRHWNKVGKQRRIQSPWDSRKRDENVRVPSLLRDPLWCVSQKT